MNDVRLTAPMGDYDSELAEYQKRRAVKDYDFRKSEEARIRELERKAAGYDAIVGSKLRIVITARAGVVTAVYAENPDMFEFLIADADSYDGLSEGDNMPTAYDAPTATLADMQDIIEIANLVRAHDDEEIVCEQCGFPFPAENHVSGSFCSEMCQDRRWRQ